METLTDRTDSLSRPDVPRYSVAGAFLEGLAAQDFDRLASALSADVHLRALVPPGLKEWDGAERVKATFTSWFGDVEDFELVDATVGEVGRRLALRWRLRMRAERLGAGWFVVEQQAYADTDDDSRIQHISLVCSGYCPETTGA
jgi:SnoaL-like protein